jgi:hypothetical protein
LISCQENVIMDEMSLPFLLVELNREGIDDWVE